MSQKRIAIFGSTGSIGRQALDVIAANPDLFSAEILTAQTNDELLIKQALQFNPNVVVIGDEQRYLKVKEALAGTPIKIFAGEDALEQVAGMDSYDMMLAAIVGYAGLRPTSKPSRSANPSPWPIKKPWWWRAISLCGWRLKTDPDHPCRQRTLRYFPMPGRRGEEIRSRRSSSRRVAVPSSARSPTFW
jgi:hypothetical protein